MKKTGTKMLALVMMAATPGFMFGFSCTGALRTSRDAALVGLGDFVEGQTFDILTSIFPDRTADE